MQPQVIIDLVVLIAWVILVVTWALSALFAKPYERREYHGWLWRWVVLVILLVVFHSDPQLARVFVHPLFLSNLP